MTLYILIGAVVLTVLATVGFVLNRLKIAGVNEAIVVSGSRNNGEVKVISPGGKTFVIPVVQKASTLSLIQQQVELTIDAPDQNNVPLSIRAVATFKVGSSPENIRSAAERYTGREDQVERNARETLLGQLRAVVGTMTAENLIRERAAFASKVSEVATKELAVSGLILDSLQISGITDANNYITNLGVPEAERANQQARIARAEANRVATEAEVQARTKVAERENALAIREAELKAESDTQQAKSAAAGPLAKAERDTEIARINQAAAEQESILRERQLDAEVRRPADARLYETEKNAEADKARQVADAQAEAEAIRLKGQAESESLRLIGEAEAAALNARAEALAKLNEAGVTELLINKLPEIARELAAPMAAIDELTIISTEGAGALPKTVANNFGQLDAIVKQFTGKGLSEFMEKGKESASPDSLEAPTTT